MWWHRLYIFWVSSCLFICSFIQFHARKRFSFHSERKYYFPLYLCLFLSTEIHRKVWNIFATTFANKNSESNWNKMYFGSIPFLFNFNRLISIFLNFSPIIGYSDQIKLTENDGNRSYDVCLLFLSDYIKLLASPSVCSIQFNWKLYVRFYCFLCL